MKKSISRAVILFLAAAFLALTPGSTVSADEWFTVKVTGTYGQTEARTMLDMINEFRTNEEEAWYWNENNIEKVYCKGLDPLEYDYDLEKLAMERAMEIALYYDHQRPDGDRHFFGENIAAGYSSAASVFTAWQETDLRYEGQGHRRNMLDDEYESVGIGHVCVDGRHTWVQVFSTASSSGEATEPFDGERTLDVEILESKITEKTITPSVGEMNLVVGESVELPELSMKIRTNLPYPIPPCPVSVDYTWYAANWSASIKDGKLYADKPGFDSLLATVLGEDIYVPVTVVSTEEERNVLDNAKYFQMDENGVLTKYTGKSEWVVIPNTVKTIGEYAFSDCTSLENITIPDSVKTIGDRAFFKCTSLESITIPNSVTSIGDYAFASCTSLRSVTIKRSITKIGAGAFGNCTSLKNITIPDSITTIEAYAFQNCTSLESVIIPNSVTSIESDSFANCISLKSINIPNSVTTIEAYAFQNCTSLESVTIPDSVTSIGVSAFPSNTTIYCNKGSAAERFAQNYGMNYVLLNGEETSDEGTAPDEGTATNPNTGGTTPEEGTNPNTGGTAPDEGTTPEEGTNPSTGGTTPDGGTATNPNTGGTQQEQTYDDYEEDDHDEDDHDEDEEEKPVRLKQQKITAKNITKTYGAKPFPLGAKTNGNGRLTYTVEDEKVASVSNTGKVTIKGYGVTRITVTAEESQKYREAAKTITLTVKPVQQKISYLKSQKAKTLTVKWKKDKKASGYILQYSTDKKFKKAVKTVTVKKNGTVKKTISKLQKGKKYYVRVCAYKTSGRSTIRGAYSTAKSVTVKK